MTRLSVSRCFIGGERGGIKVWEKGLAIGTGERKHSEIDGGFPEFADVGRASGQWRLRRGQFVFFDDVMFVKRRDVC